MKFLHLSDLHVGKRVNEFNLLEDQRFILRQILRIADEYRPDAVLIAGDLYDRSIPVGAAVELLDDFLTELAGRKLQVFAISGNHDSPERLDFGSRIMRKNGVHIAGTFSGALNETVLTDPFGSVHVFQLPFLKPAAAAPFFGEEAADTTENAVRAALGTVKVREGERNILVAHQFVTAGGKEPIRCDSETVSVGGTDQVDSSVFSAFDYVALGHLHGAQYVGRPAVRYAGSPLKYSFSEARQEKSVTLAELGEKGRLEISEVSLSPLHDMREIKGPLAELIRPAIVAQGDPEDYIRAILTDEREVADAVGKLRAVYPNLMRIDFENVRSTPTGEASAARDVPLRTPDRLFEEFYELQNNTGLSDLEREKLKKAVGAAMEVES